MTEWGVFAGLPTGLRFAFISRLETKALLCLRVNKKLHEFIDSKVIIDFYHRLERVDVPGYGIRLRVWLDEIGIHRRWSIHCLECDNVNVPGMVEDETSSKQPMSIPHGLCYWCILERGLRKVPTLCE